jgi:hypothetical protein
MKKTNTKLQFKKNTVRILQGSELAGVAGGEPTANCTNEAQTCTTSGGPTVDLCAPTHRIHGCHTH